jgi:rSAM/selenodomain-associated transferase 2
MTGASIKNEKVRIEPLHPKLSIIVPILNEIELLPELLAHLQQWQRKGCEVLLVDGGSSDGSADVAEAIGFKVLRSSRGRSRQMNAGAASAKGSVLVFLHADTQLPANADVRISKALKDHHWGRFDVQLSGDKGMLRVISFFMNCRSRLTGIATGDQTIFVDRATFKAVGGFPEQPLMEDIEMSKRLRRLGHPSCIQARVISSGRRWLTHGVWPTIWLMWRLRWRYWRGESAECLSRLYQ